MSHSLSRSQSLVGAPKVGDRLQARRGRFFTGEQGKEYYQAGDVGSVSRVVGDQFFVAWERTGHTCCFPELSCKQHVKRVSEGVALPSLGDRLQALPGQSLIGGDGRELIREGDFGTVASFEDGNMFVVWERTQNTSSLPRVGWLEFVRLVSTGQGLLEPGDRVQVLSGRQLKSEEGVEIFAGTDFGVVSRVDDQRVYVVWERTMRAGALPARSWRESARLVSSGEGFASPKPGDRIQALPGQSYVGTGGVAYYDGGDYGVVSRIEAGKLFVMWERSSRIGTLPEVSWREMVRIDSTGWALPVMGDKVQALEGKVFNPASKTGRYEAGDKGVVSRLEADKVQVVWSKTGNITAFPQAGWREFLTTLPGGVEVPAVNDRVKALPGRKFSDKNGKAMFSSGDQGVVSMVGEEQICISWERTESTGTIPRACWLELLDIVANGEAGPELGSVVQALLGASLLGADGLEYFQEHNRGVVSGMGEHHCYICWQRTGQISALPWERWRDFIKQVPGENNPTFAASDPEATIQEEVRINSKYVNIAGCYAKERLDEAGFPVYRRREGGENEMYLVHRSIGMWVLTDDPVGGARFNCHPSNEMDVTQLQPKGWQKTGLVAEICPSTSAETIPKGLPSAVYINSETASAQGVYARLGDNFDGYPAYAHEDSGMLLFHVLVDGCWHLGKEMSRKKSLVVWKSNTMDVSRLEES